MFVGYYKRMTRGLPHIVSIPCLAGRTRPVSMSGRCSRSLKHAQRVQALLKHHEASQELGFEGSSTRLQALWTHAECAATSEALEREHVDLPHVFIDGQKHHRVYRG